MIYHVVPAQQWEAAQAKGLYEPDSLAIEGFIHASKESQVKGVLERYYPNQTGLLLLHIDEDKLSSALKYEWAASVQDEFQHIFGGLNLDAVIKTTII
ncbi:MAG: DUF952 domain-containing protein [Ferruginibacter sp.]